KNSVHHRVRKATAAGYLANQETRRGKPAQIVLAEPMPEEGEVLPAPGVLECWSHYGGDVPGGAYPGAGGNGHLHINQGVREDAEEGIPSPPIHPPEIASNTPTVARRPSSSAGADKGADKVDNDESGVGRSNPLKNNGGGRADKVDNYFRDL